MFNGYNKMIVCHATMKEIVQEWLDDNLGDQAPVVTKVSMHQKWFALPSFEIEIRGASSSANVVPLSKPQTSDK